MCAPSIAYAASYTGPDDEIVLRCGNIEWALILGFMAIRTGIVDPLNGATMLTEIVRLAPTTKADIWRAGITHALTAKNMEAQRVGLLRVAQSLVTEYGSFDVTATSDICAAVQKYVDATKF